MARFAHYFIFASAFITNLCIISNALTLEDASNKSTPIKKTSQAKIITVDAENIIIEWEQCIKTEVYKFVDSGHKNFEEIIKLVSDNTKEIEKSTRAAYINQRLEYFKVVNKLGLDAYQQNVQESNEQQSNIDQHFELTAKLSEGQFLESSEKKFNEIKLNLIHKYYTKAKDHK